MIAEKTYVRTDELGTMRVGDTRVSLDSVVAGYQRGDSPEAIQRSYRTLTTEAVYGAIAYYLSHKAEVDQYLARQEERWEKRREEHERKPSPIALRIRALRERLEAVANLSGEAHADALAALKAEFAGKVAAGELEADRIDGLLRLEQSMHRMRDRRGGSARSTDPTRNP
jgi:uncharacterized protein (DUF433 family)